MAGDGAIEGAKAAVAASGGSAVAYSSAGAEAAAYEVGRRYLDPKIWVLSAMMPVLMPYPSSRVRNDTSADAIPQNH